MCKGKCEHGKILSIDCDLCKVKRKYEDEYAPWIWGIVENFCKERNMDVKRKRYIPKVKKFIVHKKKKNSFYQETSCSSNYSNSINSKKEKFSIKSSDDRSFKEKMNNER